MAAKSILAAVFLLLAVVALPRLASAATYTVGDSIGWNIPSEPTSYSDWAATKTFLAGDILLFNFTTGLHDVTEVTKASFDTCAATNPISSTKSGPARITLTDAGSRHFICSFAGHCGTGQKLSVTVRSQSSPPPTTAPPPSNKPKKPSPPPHSGHPPKASPPTATPPPSDNGPSAQTPPAAPPPRNSATSLGGFGVFFSAGLTVAVALIY